MPLCVPGVLQDLSRAIKIARRHPPPLSAIAASYIKARPAVTGLEPISEMGQTRKNSVRAKVFRFTSNSDIARRSRHFAFVPALHSGSCCLSCNGGNEGTRWYYFTGQHLFRSDDRPVIRPALASGDGVLSLKSLLPPRACVSRPAIRQRTGLSYSIPRPCERH